MHSTCLGYLRIKPVHYCLQAFPLIFSAGVTVFAHSGFHLFILMRSSSCSVSVKEDERPSPILPSVIL